MLTISCAILFTDGTITLHDLDFYFTGKESLADQAARQGSILRNADNSIAAIRYGFERPCWTWVGHANQEQMEAIAKAEAEGRW